MDQENLEKKVDYLESKIINNSNEVNIIRVDSTKLKNDLLTVSNLTKPIVNSYYSGSDTSINTIKQKLLMSDLDLEISEFLLIHYKNDVEITGNFLMFKKFKTFFIKQLREEMRGYSDFESFLNSPKGIIRIEKIKRKFLKENGG